MKSILLANLFCLVSLSLFAQGPQDEYEPNLIANMSFQIQDVQTSHVVLEVSVTASKLPQEGELTVFIGGTSAATEEKISSEETIVTTLTFPRISMNGNNEKPESYYLGCEISTTQSSQTDGCIVTIGGE